MDEKDINLLCDQIRQTCYELHRFLKHGHLEKVYENALVNRLKKQNIDVLQQYPVNVYDEDGTILGEYFADLFAENCLIVELKATNALCEQHFAQLLGYLRASRIEHGVIINFGNPRMQIRKFILREED